MRVVHLNYSDIDGGAARAAYRIHKSLESSGIDSLMWVNKTISGDSTVETTSKRFERVLNKTYPYLVKPIVKMLKTNNQTLHSPQIFPSGWVKKINNSNADILHLHWTQNEMLSISDIKLIKKPIVWTLHDMWAFCGAEHYTNDYRWKIGYNSNNRPNYESGFDINYWTWKRKKKNWKKPIQIIAPSNWLGNCAKESVLFQKWPIEIIPYPIDINFWKPLEKEKSREFLGLPKNVPLILFGAVGGGADPRKGYDLLINSLKFININNSTKKLKLVVFGQERPRDFKELNFPVLFMGYLYDNFTLRALYSAADIMIVPSRQEAFGQTALEAQACGTPVVAFKTGGLKDIVLHKFSGYLADTFEVEDLANGINWIFENLSKSNKLGLQSRDQVIKKYKPEQIANQYIDIYNKILCGNNQ